MMFYNDHSPAHSHARLGDHEMLIAISGLEVIRGSLPQAKLRRVLAWAGKNQAKLALNWIRCQDGEEAERID
jgi:hypothetical protein